MFWRPLGARMFTSAAFVIIVFIFIAYIELDLGESSRRLIDEDFVTSDRHSEKLQCVGPWGKQTFGAGVGFDLDIPYPKPVGGSYEALGLSKTWMTADKRYGPYGLGAERDTYKWPKVQWNTLDWKRLQDDCLQLNSHRFPNVNPSRDRGPAKKLKLKTLKNNLVDSSWERPARTPKQKYGRTAVVIRSWDSYLYTQEDLANLRSLMVELSLDSSSDYEVFLFVHIRDTERGIFTDDNVYDDVLHEVVPAELRNITVLFDYNLLESWYPKTPTHVPEFQMFQGLQLFAQEFDQFDHYWQLEMDVRFTGNAREYLDAMGKFGRDQPRRQAWERSTYFYFPDTHGSYSQFTQTLAQSSRGSEDEIWGPVRIPEIEPQGPTPPSSDPNDDDFKWGVGDDADVIVTHPAKDVDIDVDWVYRDWVFNFEQANETKRWVAPPAVSRGSWNVLNAVHSAQVKKGLAIPSESTLVSFALWHGFKLVYPPQPWWMFPSHDQAELDTIFNDGPPREGKVFSCGDAKIHPGGYDGYAHTSTWWWRTSSPGMLVDAWLRGSVRRKDSAPKAVDATKPANTELSKEDDGDIWEWAGEGEMPYLLRIVDGEIWMPNIALHPVKTNHNPV